MIKRFLEMGFNIVDQKMVTKIRNSEKATLAYKDPAAAAALGRDFGAEIIIIGEAFSHEVGASDGLQGCRARVEAKAIRTSNGQILATDGKHASGKDVSRLIAGKKALAAAGGELANYFLTQLCEQANATNDENEIATTSEVLIGNLTFVEASNARPTSNTWDDRIKIAGRCFGFYSAAEQTADNTLVNKLATYALGRSLDLGDRDWVDALNENFAKDGYRLRGLISKLVRSEAFRTK